MRHKYKKFRFRREWVTFIKTLDSDTQKSAMFDAIAWYGIDGIEPQGLDCDTLRYFNEVVRPDLDKQHQAKSNRNDLKRAEP